MPSEKWYKLNYDDFEVQWLSIQEELSSEVGQGAYTAWIKKISPSGINDGCAYFKAPTRLVKERVNAQYTDTILNLLRKTNKNIQSINLFCGVVPKAITSHKLQELQKKETERSIQLPLWPDEARGVPNSIIRGCLFSAIHSKSAKYYAREVILDEKNLKITFTGKQLTQADLNVWEQILHMSREQNLGYDVLFTANGFLKSLGKTMGKRDHEYLKNVLSRLNASSVEITHNGMTYMGSLIGGGVRDEEKQRYRLHINPQLARLYSAGFTLTNWEERKRIGNRPLALWLHSYIASHAELHKTKVETFHRLCGSHTSNLRRFKMQMKEALQFLLDEGIIKGFSIEEHLIHIENIPSKTQEKYLKSHGFQGTHPRVSRNEPTGFKEHCD